MRYLSVPGHFGVRGKVVSVTRDEDGAAQGVDAAVGDAEFALGSADVGNEAQLSELAEDDAVEFEVCFLWFSEEEEDEHGSVMIGRPPYRVVLKMETDHITRQLDGCWPQHVKRCQRFVACHTAIVRVRTMESRS